MDVGTSFIDFLLQHDMAEVAKNIEKKPKGFFRDFSIFGYWVVGMIL